MSNMATVDMVATGNNILSLRKNAGMTVKDLQQVFGFASPQAIYKWQSGQAMPSLDNLVVLSATFNVKLDDIVIRK